MTEPTLLTSWAVCGIAAAAARFVPVPLLDDVIRQRATQVAVVRTLRAHGRREPTAALAALWAPTGRRGLGRRLGSVGRRAVLFPVRKYVAVAGAVRGVPTDLLQVVLLARTVDRVLERGGLAAGAALPEQARRVRTAVDEAIERMDLRLLTAALADALRQVGGLRQAAVAFARARFGAADPDGALAPGAPVERGAERVTEVLRRPQMLELLDRFDRQVDERLAGPAR